MLILNSVPGVAYRLFGYSALGNPNETQTGNGDTLFFQTPPVVGNLTYMLEVSNQGCVRTISPVLNLASEYLSASVYHDQIAVQAGVPIQLNDTIALVGPNISWDFGADAHPPTATGLNPVFQYPEPGLYTAYVKASGQSDCPARDTVQVEVFGKDNLPAGSLTDCEEHSTPLIGSEVETQEHIFDVHRAADGTVYTIGYRLEYSIGWHYNLSIHKLAPDGHELWSYLLPQSEQAADVLQRIGTSIAADEAGNMYLTGTYYGSEISLGGQIIYNGQPNRGGFVAKLDPQGNLLWHIRMPGFSRPVGVTDLLYINDQQIYLVTPETPVFEFPDGFKYTFQPDNMLGLIQIDAQGHFVRARSIAQYVTDDLPPAILSNFNPNLSSFNGLATTMISPRMSLDKQGRIVLVGEYRSPMQVGSQLLTPYILHQRNGFIVYTDQNMDILGAFSTYGVTDISSGTAFMDDLHQINDEPTFAIDDDGNVFQSFSIENFDNSPRHAEVLDNVVEYGSHSHFLLKYSPAGDLLWYRRNGPLKSPWLATGPGGSVYALTSYRDMLGLNDADGTKRSVASLGGRDIALVSWDKNGVLTGALPLGTANDDLPGWLLSDGCGRLTALLTRHSGPNNIGDPLQYFQLVQFGEAGNCTPDCPFAIYRQPQTLAFCRGENAYLNVGATGNALSYQWQHESGTGNYTDLTNDATYSGAQTALLQIAAAQAPALAGQQYRCRITNGSNSPLFSGTATLMPLDTPVVAPLPSVTAIALDQFASVAAHASGNGLKYEWQYLSPQGWLPASGLSLYFFANEDSMLIKGYDPGLQNGQQLRCFIFNAEGCWVYTTTTILQFVNETSNPVATDLSVRVGPSPFADELYLLADGRDSETVNWTVFDVSGREILRQSALTHQKTTLPTHLWATGIYLIRAECGGRVVWKRVVKGL